MRARIRRGVGQSGWALETSRIRPSASSSFPCRTSAAAGARGSSALAAGGVAERVQARRPVSATSAIPARRSGEPRSAPSRPAAWRPFRSGGEVGPADRRAVTDPRESPAGPAACQRRDGRGDPPRMPPTRMVTAQPDLRRRQARTPTSTAPRPQRASDDGSGTAVLL